MEFVFTTPTSRTVVTQIGAWVYDFDPKTGKLTLKKFIPEMGGGGEFKRVLELSAAVGPVLAVAEGDADFRALQAQAGKLLALAVQKALTRMEAAKA